MRVRTVINKNGRAVPNQFIIEDVDATYLQSYQSIIVKKDYNDGVTYLDEYYWDYSNTTGKYRNLFLGEKKPETERKIKQGIYKLTNLN